MIWWAKNRGCWWVVATAVVSALVLVATKGTVLTIPSLAGLQAVAQPIGFFTPIPLVIAYTAALSRTSGRLESGTRRPTRWADLALAAAAISVLLVPQLVAPADVVLIGARNSIIALGVALVCHQVLGRDTAALLPITWILVGTLTGRSYGHDAWWNWPVMASDSPLGLIWAAGAAILGAAAHLFSHR